MKIYELPTEIQNRVFQLQTEAGNTPNADLDIIDKPEAGNFNWARSSEGVRFWKKIHWGFYKNFYDRYPNKPVTVHPAEVRAESFVSDVVYEIMKSNPLTLSEHNFEELKTHIENWLNAYNVDSFYYSKVEIVNEYKRKMRERYNPLCELLDRAFPGGMYSKDADDTLFGINVMAKKFICETTQMLKDAVVEHYLARSAMSPEHSPTWLEDTFDEAVEKLKIAI